MKKKETPYFIIKNDSYISSYLDSLSSISKTNEYSKYTTSLLSVKFEELMLYLIDKYKENFEIFLHSLVVKELSPFKSIIEKNVFSNLKLEEIAFLCNMSMSTFKRYFKDEYNASPGKWFLNQRLQKAKEILEQGKLKPIDIFMNFGYNNLSNFSIAFKNKFNINPTEVCN